MSKDETRESVRDYPYIVLPEENGIGRYNNLDSATEDAIYEAKSLKKDFVVCKAVRIVYHESSAAVEDCENE